MRFMVMHKMTEEMEKGLPPDPATIEAVGKLIGEGLKEKVFVSGEGLKPSSQRVHIAYKNGRRTITDGPFAEAKELVAGFALMRGERGRGPADAGVVIGPLRGSWPFGVGSCALTRS